MDADMDDEDDDGGGSGMAEVRNNRDPPSSVLSSTYEVGTSFGSSATRFEQKRPWVMEQDDRLGYDRPSKAVDWLINKAKNAIAKLDELPE
ncbi:hypothetical protein RJ639_016153 [Escallonia herrerae]|uniref:TCP domain-containing protein n=1 Tax=Escallonia herrerae TaxID=1293975 RepID=A0AA88VG39_9ASTE|nr:hypothetical protein RJ639_016153 [Escallonia herrerae]